MLVGKKNTSSLSPFKFSTLRFNVDLSQFDLLIKVEEKLQMIPEFYKAHPDQQPDKQ